MKSSCHRVLAIGSVLILVAAASFAVPALAQSESTWSFDGIDRIELDGVSGDLELVAGTGSTTTLRLVRDVSPAGAFTPEVEQEGSTLRIEELWDGRSTRSNVRWVLTIPASVRPTIEMDSASGGIAASGVSGRFEIDTASGDFELRDGTLLAGSSIDTASGDLSLTDVAVEDGVGMSTASGDVDLSGITAGRTFKFSTASGDVSVRRSSGVLKGSSASGDVTVEDSDLNGSAEFTSASGDVVVRLGDAPTHDLSASSASGDVELRAASLGDNFTLVMTARKDRGRIDNPFPVTSQETFERHGEVYIRQTVERGSGGPEIRLGTASGKVVVREGR